MIKTFVFKLPPEVKFNNVNDLINFFGQLSHMYIGNNNNEDTLIYFWKLFANNDNYVYDEESNCISFFVDKNYSLISYENAKNIRFVLFLTNYCHGSIDAENDKNYYLIKVSDNKEKIVVKGFENEGEFNECYNFEKIRHQKKYNYFLHQVNNLNKKIKIAKEIIITLIALSIIFIAATLLTLGFFTCGVLPAVLTPLLAKCLMGVLGGIGVLGFLASLIAYSKCNSFEKSKNLLLSKINNLQDKINDLARKDNELGDNERNNNKPKSLKYENDNRNEHED